MDYSKIDDDIKEDIADRIAMAVVTLYDLAHVTPSYALDNLFKTMSELKKLVYDLGGHPAIDAMDKYG